MISPATTSALALAAWLVPAEAPTPTEEARPARPVKEQSIAELVGGLKSCDGLESCAFTRELIRRGQAIWPGVQAGLDAADEMTRFWTRGVLSEVLIVDSREAIAASLDDKLVRVRAAAAFALGNHRDKAVTGWLLKALKDKDLNVRFAAAVGLGRVRDDKAVPDLIRALRDEDDDVRAYAALALGDIKDRRATPGLLERLREDLKGHVRGRAAMALGVLQDPAALDPLIAAVGEEKDTKALASAIFALGALGDPKALPTLEPLEEHADKDVREYAAEAIAAIRQTAADKAGRAGRKAK